MEFFRQLGYGPTRSTDETGTMGSEKSHVDRMTNLPDNQELDDILMDPDYDQSMLQDWFKRRYGDHWRVLWNRYLETGQVSVWLR